MKGFFLLFLAAAFMGSLMKELSPENENADVFRFFIGVVCTLAILNGISDWDFSLSVSVDETAFFSDEEEAGDCFDSSLKGETERLVENLCRKYGAVCKVCVQNGEDGGTEVFIFPEETIPQGLKDYLERETGLAISIGENEYGE